MLRPRGVLRGWVAPIAAGSLIAVAGLTPWALLARANATFHPEIPWAAVATLLWLALLLAWLGGSGPPRRWARLRRRLLRLWPRVRTRGAREGEPIAMIVVLLVFLYFLWIVVARPVHRPDLTAYPTTAFRVSVLVLGAVVSGVVEEAAFRGYMQSLLEPQGTDRAIIVTSIVFTLFHGVDGLPALLAIAPGLFAASVLYGLLAARTGTILPGMLIHTLGDLAYTYFGVLHGDSGLLYAAAAP